MITLARTIPTIRTISTLLLVFTLTGLSVSFTVRAAAAAAPGAAHETSRRLYERVMEEFRKKDYEAALAGFRFFMELHGQSALAGNAQYWVGECQYRLRRYKDALETFYNVMSYYPLSPKLAASTLKIAQIYTKLGDKEKARLMYDRVLDQYPESAEAEVARRALDVTGGKGEAETASLE